MKKLLALLTITGSMIACNNSAKESESSKDTTTATDTSSATMAPAKDSSAMMTTTAPSKDSLMQFKDGKVMIMTNGSWSALSGPVTTTNGRKVSPNGEVTKNGKKRKMEEGMMIDKDGQLMDKDGKPMDNTGWE